MANWEITKLQNESTDIIAWNIEKIWELFPNVIVESENGKSIDFEALKQELSKEIVDWNKERYQLTWPGKKEAIATASQKCNKTLRPVKERSVDFDNTKNIYIEWDNLEALKILQESYLWKIDCIYIDPPYNTGKDFVYNDNFYKKTEQELIDSWIKDKEGNVLVSEIINTDSNGKFHSSWLSMMYPRLKLARNLLKNDWIIFISIDDNESSNLKKMCDEIFWERNFVSQSIRRTINSWKHDAIGIAPFHEYLLIYVKNIDLLNINKKLKSEEDRDSLYKNEDEFLTERWRFYITQLNKNSIQYSDSLNYPIKWPDWIDIWPWEGFNDKKRCWRRWKQKLQWWIDNWYIVFKKSWEKYKVYTKSYEFVDKDWNKIDRSNPYSSLEFIDKKYANFNATPELEKLFDGKKYFDFPKAELFIKELLFIANKQDWIFLDFFSWSATTAHACLDLNSEDSWNRNFIMVQLPEYLDEKSEAFKDWYKNICEIWEERIRRAWKKIKEETNADIDYWFRVYKVDSSNYNEDINKAPGELDQNSLFDSITNLKIDRTPEDLLTWVILHNFQWTLDLKIEEQKIWDNNFFFVDDNALLACFDDKINLDIIEELAKYEPLKVVFKDSAFTDQDKINLSEKFKRYSPSTEILVL